MQAERGLVRGELVEDGPVAHAGLTATAGCRDKATGDEGGCEVSCDDGYYISSGSVGPKVCLADVGGPTASFRDLPRCVKCEETSYTNDDVGHDQCTIWTLCGEGWGRDMSTGDFVSDLQCVKCDSENGSQFNGANDHTPCGEHTKCGKGQGLTGHSDTEAGSCEVCATNFFSASEDADECEDGNERQCVDHSTKNEASVCVCDSGYFATTVVTWNNVGGIWEGVCVPQWSEVVTNPEGHVGTMECGAEGSEEKFTWDISTCEGVSCKDGYRGSVVYHIADAPGGETTLDGCVENVCAIYSFGIGVVGAGGDDDCTATTALTTHNDPQCGVKCEPGYAAASATLTCASDAATQPASTAASCADGMRLSIAQKSSGEIGRAHV